MVSQKWHTAKHWCLELLFGYFSQKWSSIHNYLVWIREDLSKSTQDIGLLKIRKMANCDV